MAGRGGKTKKDGEYRPKKAPTVSEDEDDDFEDVVADAASAPSVCGVSHGSNFSNIELVSQAGKKRKVIVLEGEEPETTKVGFVEYLFVIQR